VTFTHLLHDLIGMVGAAVTITASTTDGHPVLATTGAINIGIEVLGAEPGDPEETIYFPLNISGTGFMITRSAFGGAQWDGDVLLVELGSMTLSIEPSD
jgi:hypothetical protein